MKLVVQQKMIPQLKSHGVQIFQWCLSNINKMLSNNDIRKRWSNFNAQISTKKKWRIYHFSPLPHSSFPTYETTWDDEGNIKLNRIVLNNGSETPLQSWWAFQVVMDSDVSRTQKIIRILLQSCIFPLVSPSDSCNKKACDLAFQ